MLATAFCACGLFAQAITPEVIEHAQAGAAALRENRLDAAIQEFQKVVELQPGSASGHANLGEAYFQKGRYRDAIAEAEQALKILPNVKGADQTAGAALLVEGDPAGAVPHLEKTSDAGLLGRAYLETGQLGSAIMTLGTALGQQPKDADLLYYLGRAADTASQWTAGQLASMPPGAAPPNGRAADGTLPRDVFALERALINRPNDPAVLAAFSKAAAEAAQRAYDEVLQTSPDSARAHQILAERAEQSGHADEAEREYAEALRRKPDAADAHLNLGDVFAGEGNLGAAAAQYRMAADLQPLNPDAFYRLGRCDLDLGKGADAVEQLVQADRLRPNTPQILLALGQGAMAGNDAARAEEAWKKLLEIDSRSDLAAAAHSGLAEIYRQAGRIAEAERETAAYAQLKGGGGR
jgi:tetratricopeptide (TPR) repeat protein